jgi:hypothetical protein
MRIIAVMPDEKQVGTLTDSLKNIGFDRKDMIISSLADDKVVNNVEDAIEKGISMIKTERNSLNDTEAFAEGVKSLKSNRGILVAVKTPKHEATRVREIMEQSGSVEVIEDAVQ